MRHQQPFWFTGCKRVILITTKSGVAGKTLNLHNNSHIFGVMAHKLNSQTPGLRIS